MIEDRDFRAEAEKALSKVSWEGCAGCVCGFWGQTNCAFTTQIQTASMLLIALKEPLGCAPTTEGMPKTICHKQTKMDIAKNEHRFGGE